MCMLTGTEEIFFPKVKKLRNLIAECKKKEKNIGFSNVPSKINVPLKVNCGSLISSVTAVIS